MAMHEALLRREVENLREENRQLRDLLKQQCHTPRDWGLTASEESVCLALLMREVVRKDFLYAAVYDVWHPGPEPKIIDVFIYNLRRKLGPYQFHIETVYGRGYAVRDRLAWRQKLGMTKPRGVEGQSPDREARKHGVE